MPARVPVWGSADFGTREADVYADRLEHLPQSTHRLRQRPRNYRPR